jgi:hypothetical protein
LTGTTYQGLHFMIGQGLHPYREFPAESQEISMAAEQSKPQGPDLGQGVSVSDISDGGMLAESGQLNALGGQDSSRLDAYWRAANYLSLGRSICLTIHCC